MRDKSSRDNLILLKEELNRLLCAAPQIPYSALSLEPTYGGQVICFSRRIEELTGYSADQILADRHLWISIIHPADRHKVLAAFVRCKGLGIASEVGYRIIHKDGSLRYVIDAGEPIFNDKGQVTEIEGIITDVSEYKKARICICQDKPKVTKLHNADSSVFVKV